MQCSDMSTSRGSEKSHFLSGIQTSGLLSCAPTAHHLRQTLPAVRIRNLRSAKVLVQIENDLECVSATRKRRGVEGSALGYRGHDLADADLHLLLRLAARHGQECLEDFVGGEGETELRGGSEDSGGTTLEEGRETLFFPDGLGGVSEAGVRGFALAGLDLQTSLDDVAWRREVGGGHAGNGTGGKELQDTQLLGG